MPYHTPVAENVSNTAAPIQPHATISSAQQRVARNRHKTKHRRYNNDTSKEKKHTKPQSMQMNPI